MMDVIIKVQKPVLIPEDPGFDSDSASSCCKYAGYICTSSGCLYRYITLSKIIIFAMVGHVKYGMQCVYSPTTK